MFNFSLKTFVNKEYKLSDFLKQIKASKEVINDSSIIEKVFFRNVINANTLNCLEDKKYKLIYVIEIVVNSKEVPIKFIEALDKNIAFYTYFIIRYNDEIATTIAFKDINKSIIIGKYYSHYFHKPDYIDLPIVNNVPDVYKILLSYESKVNYRKYENPDDFDSRLKLINKLNFQISKTEKAIIYENQPKKKFEYNKRLREYKKDLENLMNMEE